MNGELMVITKNMFIGVTYGWWMQHMNGGLVINESVIGG